MNNQKQEQARTLFFQTDLGKAEIADMLSIPRRTLHHWIRHNNWDRQKESSDIMPSYLAENCYHVIDRFTKQLLAAENITHKDADALHKFTLTVNKLKNRTTLNENMETFARFIDSVNAKSPQAAQLIAPFIDDYIATQAKSNNEKFEPAKNMAARKEDPVEQLLDQQDIEFWEQENRQAGETPSSDSDNVVNDPASSSSVESNPRTEKGNEQVPADEKAEAYIESFKQMFPNFTDELTHEFRKFYHENFSTNSRTVVRAA